MKYNCIYFASHRPPRLPRIWIITKTPRCCTPRYTMRRTALSFLLLVAVWGEDGAQEPAEPPAEPPASPPGDEAEEETSAPTMSLTLKPTSAPVCDHWCNPHTCDMDRCTDCNVCDELASGDYCAWWCNVYTCYVGDYCQGCTSTRQQPACDKLKVGTNCEPWCNSWTCWAPGGYCDGCFSCRVSSA